MDRNFEWATCMTCNRLFKRRKSSSTRRLKYGVKRAGSKTCSSECSKKWTRSRWERRKL